MDTTTGDLNRPGSPNALTKAAESHQQDSNECIPVINPFQGEENPVDYQPGGYHPVYIGEVYNGRYKVLNKIGWGMYSTVWIVEDLESK